MTFLILLLPLLLACYLVAVAFGKKVLVPTLQDHEDHLNRIDPEGKTAGHKEHVEVQSYSGPGCGWCCAPLFWYGIPIGTSCTYVCNSGH